MRIAVIYEPGDTAIEEMAAAVAAGAESAGAEVWVWTAAAVTPEQVAAADGVIWGSPSQLGLPGFGLRGLMEALTHSPVARQLQGKPGGVFCTAGTFRGKREGMLLSLLTPMLSLGMAVVGLPPTRSETAPEHQGTYGAAAMGQPDQQALTRARELGQRVAEMAGAIFQQRAAAGD